MARRKNDTKSKVNIKPNKDEDESFNIFAYKFNSRKNLNILELNVSQQTTSVAWRKSCFEKVNIIICNTYFEEEFILSLIDCST